MHAMHTMLRACQTHSALWWAHLMGFTVMVPSTMTQLPAAATAPHPHTTLIVYRTCSPATHDTHAHVIYFWPGLQSCIVRLAMKDDN